jgi:hypothetical protein
LLLADAYTLPLRFRFLCTSRSASHSKTSTATAQPKEWIEHPCQKI